ncbi:low-density lipoprotein receptor repeat class B domain-containing protein [Phthorimaea operculella]|nr:low-density lipoprotein receptor repeat class B domain-containing protein [Phthorimaea operculella]
MKQNAQAQQRNSMDICAWKITLHEFGVLWCTHNMFKVALDMHYASGCLFWSDVTRLGSSIKKVCRTRPHSPGSTQLYNEQVQVILYFSCFSNLLRPNFRTLPILSIQFAIIGVKPHVIGIWVHLHNFAGNDQVVVDQLLEASLYSSKTACSRAFFQYLFYYTPQYLQSEVTMKTITDIVPLKLLHGPTLQNPDGIAVDWVGENIYWCDKGTDTIEVSRLDGRHRKVLIRNNLSEPRALALHPQKGVCNSYLYNKKAKLIFAASANFEVRGSEVRSRPLPTKFTQQLQAGEVKRILTLTCSRTIYWSDWGQHAHIGRAGMDGSQRTVIISAGLGWPNALTVVPASNELYFADAREDYIAVSDLDGKHVRVLFSRVGLDWPNALTVVPASNELYFADAREDYIAVSDLDGKHVKVLFSRVDLRWPNALTVVPASNELYFADAREDFKAVSDLDGKHVKVLFSRGNAGLGWPNALTVVPASNELYFAEAREDYIAVSDLDGKHVKVLFSKVVPASNELYFADAREDYIAVSDLDGKHVRVLFSRATVDQGWPNAFTVSKYHRQMTCSLLMRESTVLLSRILMENTSMLSRERMPWLNLHHVFALAVWEGRIYWSDWETRAIESCLRRPNQHYKETNRTLDISTGGAYECKTIVHTVHKPMDLRIFHAGRQPMIPDLMSQCYRRNCSGLCLITPAEEGKRPGIRCECPEHFVLADDGVSCLPNCTSAHFVCKTGLKCIPFWWRCDTQQSWASNPRPATPAYDWCSNLAQVIQDRLRRHMIGVAILRK